MVLAKAEWMHKEKCKQIHIHQTEKSPLQMAERPQHKTRYTASEEEKAEEMS